MVHGMLDGVDARPTPPAMMATGPIMDRANGIVTFAESVLLTLVASVLKCQCVMDHSTLDLVLARLMPLVVGMMDGAKLTATFAVFVPLTLVTSVPMGSNKMETGSFEE